MSTPIVPARYAGTCPLCVERWRANDPISPFGERSEHAGRWGHPACVAADDLGLPSAEQAKERLAAIRNQLKENAS